MSALIGFFVVKYQLQAPERQLLRDLPVIERVDQLRSVESLDFLEKLRDAELMECPEEESGGVTREGTIREQWLRLPESDPPPRG